MNRLFSIFSLTCLFLAPYGGKLSAAIAPSPSQTVPMKTDGDISSAVKAAFAADKFLAKKSLGIAVQVENGIVTLTGTVATEGDKASIGGKARSIGGVRDVINEIEVQKIK